MATNRSTTPVYHGQGRDKPTNTRVPIHVAKGTKYHAGLIVAKQTVEGVPPAHQITNGELYQQTIEAYMKHTVEGYGVKWEGWDAWKKAPAKKKPAAAAKAK